MKQYNNEKAIISLTSWKARINTVAKTIYSLLQQCPNFHIVLVLSEEEFPKKEMELPDNLMSFVKNDLIEILWVYKNYKAFKKIIFTMDKYRNVPVISADDDCIYTCNYAEELYNKWLKNKNCIVRYNIIKTKCTQGPCTLYPHTIYEKVIHPILLNLKKNSIQNPMDDQILTKYINMSHINIISVYYGTKFCFKFHDEIEPLHDNTKEECYKELYNENK